MFCCKITSICRKLFQSHYWKALDISMKSWSFKRAKIQSYTFGAFEASWFLRIDPGLSSIDLEIIYATWKWFYSKKIILFWKIALFGPCFMDFEIWWIMNFLFEIPIFHTKSFFLTKLNFYKKLKTSFQVKAETSYFTVGKSIC